MCVLHFDFLDFSSIFYRKFHIFRNEVSIRGLLFTKGIFAYRKFFDHMRFICGRPAFNFLSIFIQDDQFCSRYLTGIRNVFLADFHFGHIIKHLVFLYFFCVFDGKFNTFRSHITICRFCFCHLVFLSYDKTLDDMCFLFGYPFIHRISILICYL